jgi:hypothetical protein
LNPSFSTFMKNSEKWKPCLKRKVFTKFNLRIKFSQHRGFCAGVKLNSWVLCMIRIFSLIWTNRAQ